MFVRKILGIIILSLFLGSSAYSKSYTGTGDIKLGNRVINDFQEYIKLKKVKGKRADPGIFMITLDGSKSYYYYCQHNLGGGCIDNAGYAEMKRCKDHHNQECALFARKRRVLWKNGINDGKRKSQFSSKMSNSEIKDKLTSLGFIETEKIKTETKKKITKKKKSKKKDIVVK